MRRAKSPACDGSFRGSKSDCQAWLFTLCLLAVRFISYSCPSTTCSRHASRRTRRGCTMGFLVLRAAFSAPKYFPYNESYLCHPRVPLSPNGMMSQTVSLLTTSSPSHDSIRTSHYTDEEPHPAFPE